MDFIISEERQRDLNFLVSNEELLLVHRQMPEVTRKKKYDLMLTPQFYVFKKEDLPIKYQHQAAKLAPSVLDDLVTDGDYSYAAIKEDDAWVFVAYDTEKIEEFLAEKGLESKNINKIYFAQQSKEEFEFPVEIDDATAIVTINDTVTIVPKKIVESSEFAMFTNKFRPEKGFSSGGNKSAYVTGQQSLVVAGIILLLTGTYVAEGMRYQNASSELDAQIEASNAKYPTLNGKTNMILDNMYNQNIGIDKNQRKIRDVLKKISLFANKETMINELSISNKGYKAAFTPGKQTLEEMKKLAKSRGLTVKNGKSAFTLEGGL